jgi:hypothetical protein
MEMEMAHMLMTPDPSIREIQISYTVSMQGHQFFRIATYSGYNDTLLNSILHSLLSGLASCKIRMQFIHSAILGQSQKYSNEGIP